MCDTVIHHSHIITTQLFMDSRPAPSGPINIEAQGPSPETFEPFGAIVAIRIPPNLQSIDAITSSAVPDPKITDTYKLANGDTALKSRVPWTLTNGRQDPPSGIPPWPVINTFTCFPQAIQPHSPVASIFRVCTLERHPYTSQTFVPMTSPAANADTKYLVIVAPNSVTEGSGEDTRPAVGEAKALVLDRAQAVSYGAGTWHSPMVVLGPERIDFAVMQQINNVEEEDCQTVTIEGEGLQIVISHDLLA